MLQSKQNIRNHINELHRGLVKSKYPHIVRKFIKEWQHKYNTTDAE